MAADSASKAPQRDAQAAAIPPRNGRAAERPLCSGGGPRAKARHGRSVRAKLARVAGKQAGIVGHADLLRIGLSRGQIKRLVKEGALHRRYRGVYVVGHVALAPCAAERAALLACGLGAVISHWSAAYLWGLIDEPRTHVDVTLTGRRCRPKPGIRLHLARGLDKRDLRQRHGLPVTSPARTLVDLAAETPMSDLERLVAEARVKRLIRPGELEKALARAGRRTGAVRMRALLAAEGQPGITRSGAERILRRLLRDARLPAPQTNARVAGVEVDFLWARERVIVEVDSWRFHGHRRAFENDRRKTMALQAAGYYVIRVTARQLELEPLAVIAQIARALERARRR